ncbi:peroxiredoxin [Kocuria sp. p3-SID1433]|uniref:peroxiredoxin n=1 Tax=unclassified Kocuria TaxID=2649579 RepID=UPI0021A92414|nr:MULTISPECIES: peroxiredoxin [unclassified Kocuria]MCT1601163.1 peroxiredoxin [Kocuria sp. p3-SID1428]MCT2179378.1 peroxiredoxin [Kocuria sp. p3-SID1433]
MIEIGQFAPDFTLTNQYGEDVTLAEHLGRPVALVFYPFAFSSVCTGEMCQLQDMMDEVQEADALLLAVSTDSQYVLKAFSREESLEFDLLSDFWPHGETARAFGVFDETTGMASRTTFLIDADGIVLDRFTSEITSQRPVERYREALAKLPAPTA